jgi:hypothetical protein
MRSICCRATAPCSRFNSLTAAPASRRAARLTMAEAISRSRSNAADASPAGGSACRCTLRNSAGSSRMRCRIAGGLSRHAAYNRPAARVSQCCAAKIAAIRWQSSRQMRAAGTRYFMATCAESLPSRTCCWIASGRDSTSASRRDTQLTLRSKRRANSSRLYPKRCSNSASSQPSSSAVSDSDSRSVRSSSTASASRIGHTTASTVSRPSCRNAAMRL